MIEEIKTYEERKKELIQKGSENMAITQIQKTTLTMKEASEYLGISYWLVNQLVKRKQIPFSKVGGKFLFRIKALDDYLSEKEKSSMNK